MPSTKYTRIEITKEAYEGLEAEAIIQGKTLKRLASDLILKGISKKALNFVQDSTNYSENKKNSIELIKQAKDELFSTNLEIDNTALEKLKIVLQDEGYQGAMLYVAQNTASLQRDELFRILIGFQNRKIPSAIAVDIINDIRK
jgi:hypothetical protein